MDGDDTGSEAKKFKGKSSKSRRSCTFRSEWLHDESYKPWLAKNAKRIWTMLTVSYVGLDS